MKAKYAIVKIKKTEKGTERFYEYFGRGETDKIAKRTLELQTKYDKEMHIDKTIWFDVVTLA